MNLKFCSGCQNIIQIMDNGNQRVLTKEEKTEKNIPNWNKLITDLFNAKEYQNWINCKNCRSKPVKDWNLPTN